MLFVSDLYLRLDGGSASRWVRWFSESLGLIDGLQFQPCRHSQPTTADKRILSALHLTTRKKNKQVSLPYRLGILSKRCVQVKR